MKTLINAVEEWIDLRIFANNKNAIYEAQFKEMLARAHQNESIAVRQANRIEELERRIKIMNDSPPIGRESATDLSARLDHQEQRIALWIDEGDTSRLDSVDSRLDDLECSMDEKLDSYEVADGIDSALADLDLPDAYSVQVMIDDALETKVLDAVRAELDATDFKITVER